MHHKVLAKISKALDTCCAIDESPDESNKDSDDSLLELSAPMKPSRYTTRQRELFGDSKSPAITPVTSQTAASRRFEKSAYEEASDDLINRPSWSDKPRPIGQFQ
jgi:hypothetical protein